MKRTTKKVRKIPVITPTDYRNEHVEALLKSAEEVSTKAAKAPTQFVGQTISKIK